jgi:squalene-hopene/tetraprenyl-beta-curcumene cyclase
MYEHSDPGTSTLNRLDLRKDLQATWDLTLEFLNHEAHDGHWPGQLSTSALSTATAVSAISLCRKHHCIPQKWNAVADEAIAVGCQWLADHQNPDGGFGDTDRSHSNIATSLLVAAAWQLADFDGGQSQMQQAVQYIEKVGKWDALRRRYGKDKTFVVPILTNCALAGMAQWKQVPPLPFEAAWLPQSWYRLARMPVVSYAVPALVAMGQAKFHFQPPLNPLLTALRKQAIAPTLRVLRRMQPDSGGYLEAVPLTSFVLMSLAAVGRGGLPVAQDCLRFLVESRLNDGSWPIDTNLATWLTSLSITAISRRSTNRLRVTFPHSSSLSAAPASKPPVSTSSACLTAETAIPAKTVRWLLSCQHRRRHPFTGASPGGWGWTNLSGAVPDADDTPAALLALAKLDMGRPELSRLREQTWQAVANGLRWLMDLQNRDGGWPTFCRGWGKLPFDRSGTDLTAHALRAFRAWLPELENLREVSAATPTESQILQSTYRGLKYIQKMQRPDGSWLPLWFGNQDHDQEDNPIYGTGKVLLAFADLQRTDSPVAQAGFRFLMHSQNPDGGWGGGPSIKYRGSETEGSSSLEETAVALEALLQFSADSFNDSPTCASSIERGLRWLVTTIKRDNLSHSSPIGFYFAKLWYYERLYPAVFSMAALGAGIGYLDRKIN